MLRFAPGLIHRKTSSDPYNHGGDMQGAGEGKAIHLKTYTGIVKLSGSGMLVTTIPSASSDISREISSCCPVLAA
jgi:predicted transcriptional regulator